MAKFRKAKEPKAPESNSQPFERTSLSRSEIMFNNFIGGIFWAIGTVVGLTVFLSALGLLAQYVNIIPFVGDFIADILLYLQARGSIQP